MKILPINISSQFERKQTKESRRFAEVVFSDACARLVQVEDFHCEVNPEGLLFYNDIDTPGLLASVGATLAGEKINIAGLSLVKRQTGAEGANGH